MDCEIVCHRRDIGRGASHPEGTPFGESSVGHEGLHWRILFEEHQLVPQNAGDTWIFSTMLYTMYQALMGISNQIETISLSQFVPVRPVMPIWLLLVSIK